MLPQDLKLDFANIELASYEDRLMSHKVELLNRLKVAYNKLVATKAKVQDDYKIYYDKTHKEINFNNDELVMIYTKAPK